jgi:hypothetical protein
MTPEWTRILHHPDTPVRLETLQQWAAQGAAIPMDPLTEALVDPEKSVRARAQELVERAWAAKARSPRGPTKKGATRRRRQARRSFPLLLL